jgi:hypothetical protein
MKHYLATLLTLFSITQLASAHTAGQSSDGAQTAQHILTSPDHLLMLGSILVVAGAFGYKRRQARKI